jgi:uncharacterized paraquat-inducible protein A
MVQIKRRQADDFRCSHCGTIYELTRLTPARDTGSAKCVVCQEIMMQWKDSPIPSFAIRKMPDRE